MPPPEAKKYQPWLVAAGIAAACAVLNLILNRHGLHRSYYELGGEYMWIAHALDSGRGFADPFGSKTGPTGWMPPAYTFLLYAIRWLTDLAGEGRPIAFIIGVIAIKCVALGATAGLGWATLQRWNASRPCLAAYLLAWILVSGWAGYDEITIDIHDGWWVAFTFSLCLHGISRITPRGHNLSLISGISLAALSSPVLYAAIHLVVGARVATFAFLAKRFTWAWAIKPALPAVVIGLSIFGGWSARIHLATGIWAPLKTNGGFELWQSLERTTAGVPSSSTFLFHPLNHAQMRDEYTRLGEKLFTAKYTQRAISALAEKPSRYGVHVANRAWNALIWMKSLPDHLALDGEMPEAVKDELVAAGAAMRTEHRKTLRYVFLRKDAAQRDRALATLSAPSASLLSEAYQIYDEIIRDLPLTDRYELRDMMRSGMITLAWAVSILTVRPRQRRRLMIPLVAYVGMLTPYILVSHYSRYQDIVSPLQVCVVALAATSIFAAMKSRCVHAR